MSSQDSLLTSFNPYCKECKGDNIFHDQKQGILKCRVCNIIYDNHYISTENEVRNFGDDKENEKLSRVEKQYFHPLFGTDDEIYTKGKKVKKEESQITKNWKQVDDKLKHITRQLPYDIKSKILRQFYQSCLKKRDEYYEKMKEFDSSNDKNQIKPKYGIEKVKQDAADAMISQMIDFSNDKKKLLNKISKKLDVDLTKLVTRYNQDIYNSTNKKVSETPLSIAQEKAVEYLNFDDNLVQALEKVYVAAESLLCNSENPNTKAGALLYLVCSNCIDPQYNKYTLKDIASFIDKEESTLKKLYSTFQKSNLMTRLPHWVGRK